MNPDEQARNSRKSHFALHLLISMGLSLILMIGLWTFLREPDSQPTTEVLPEIRTDSTPTGTSPVRSIQATSTVTEVPLPTKTPRTAVAKSPTSIVQHTPTAKVTPTATFTPTATPIPADVTRLIIPSIGVNAPVEMIGIDAAGVMENPDSPTSVGWYDFSAYPGKIGNIVFAGHVDYAGFGPAVFWDLRAILVGDTIDVISDDGSVATYRVTDIRNIDALEDARPIVSATPSPTITLITCIGTFNTSTRQYDKRLVVVGEILAGSE